MDNFDQIWQKLVREARRTEGEDDFLAAPPGFATRVAARAFTSQPDRTFWELVAVRSFIAACIVAAASVGAIASISYDPTNMTVLSDLADPLVEVAFLE